LRRASRGQQTSPSRHSVNRECQSLKLVFKSVRIFYNNLHCACVLRVNSKTQEGSRPRRADLWSTVSGKDGASPCLLSWLLHSVFVSAMGAWWFLVATSMSLSCPNLGGSQRAKGS
jgi:hypothetical protein